MLIRHEWARRYAQWGYPVFPCQRNAKRPACLHSFNDATLDLRQIDSWWNEDDYNIAICPNMVGAFVLDFDVKGGGLERFEDFRTKFGVSPIRVDTPSGGIHLWYSGHMPPSVKKVPGIDIRGEGSYVLLPPSVIDGKEYVWTE